MHFVGQEEETLDVIRKARSRSASPRLRGGQVEDTDFDRSATIHDGSDASPCSSENQADTYGKIALLNTQPYKACMHATGRCYPCRFYETVGCPRGNDCKFCHLPHRLTQIEWCNRPTKDRRRRIKQRAQRAAAGATALVEAFDGCNHTMPAKEQYINRFMRAKLWNAQQKASRVDQLEADLERAV